MSWVLTILGIVSLIVLHELGHFLAAKSVGMRVERFSLFFPPTIAKVRSGETEYAIGAIPAGGYVKITGMNPEELRDTDLRIAVRSYFMKPPWRRIFVIAAGPAVNLLIAFLLFAIVAMSGTAGGASTLERLDPARTLTKPTPEVAAVIPGLPADRVLREGDLILKIDGVKATVSGTERAITADTCSGPLRNGCRGARAVDMLVRRHGRDVQIRVRPVYDAEVGRMLVGFDFGYRGIALSPAAAAGASAGVMWNATAETVSGIAKALTSAKERKQLSSIVGITTVTQQAVAAGWGRALAVIGYVSLVLGVVNLFPFLPLDGGHIVWSLAEKLRGKRVSIAAMWRYSSVGLILLAFLVISGLSNDISRLGG